MTIIKLKREGVLQAGDTLQSNRLGVVTVAWIESPHTIVVKSQSGHYYQLSGFEY